MLHTVAENWRQCPVFKIPQVLAEATFRHYIALVTVDGSSQAFYLLAKVHPAGTAHNTRAKTTI